LDPCAAPEPRPWSTAAHMIAPPKDGLAEPWEGRVWLNPPFGSAAPLWMERMAAHGRGTALLFARTDTRMFHEFVWPVAKGLLFVRGRPHFCRPDGTRALGNSGGPVVLIAYGWEDAARLQSCGIDGWFVKPC
jgi:hypothetical protein